MNQLLLNMVMLFSGLWKSLGADVVQLRAILKVRMMLDDRKPMTFGRPQGKRKFKYGSLLNVVVSLFMGFMYLMPLIAVQDRISGLTFYFTIFLGIITFMLISDFSKVLFDSRDKFILFPRPVGDRTIVLARLLHIFIYLFRVVVPMSIPGWVFLGIADGWKSAVLFIFPLLLLVFLALFLVNGIYLIVLRLSKPERFQDIMNYFQVFTSVLFFGSFYTLPRLFDPAHPNGFSILGHQWMRFLPSFWLASCWSWIGTPSVLPGTIFYSLLAILVPVLCMYLLVRVLAPQFAKRIAGIDAVDTGEYSAKPASSKASKGSRFYQKIAYVFNNGDDARAGFMIAWLQTARSRSFRMRVYPSFAFIPIYFYFILTKNNVPLSESMSHMSQKPWHLFILYYSSFVMINAMTFVAMSDQYKAAWVYYSAPLAVPGRVMAGAFKAMWLKFFFPFYIFLACFIIYIWGAPAIWDVILAMVNITLFLVSMARVTLRHLPFSIMEQNKQAGSRVVKSLLAMILPVTLGLSHYFCIVAHLLWLKFIFLGLASIFLWLVWTSYNATTWDNVIRGELE